MKLNHTYQLTPIIQQHLINIKANKKASLLLPPPSKLVLNNLIRHSTLKSAVYSARIEGNPLTIHQAQIKSKPTQSTHHREISNLYQAIQWIYKKEIIPINPPLIKKLHQLAMQDITAGAGQFRIETSAIFNAAGVAIYLTPPPQQIKTLIQKLTNLINTSQNPTLIQAAITHYAFEKIHPFLDGNGRVGRLLIHCILKNHQYDFQGLINIDEYLENHRQSYYDLLSTNQKDITDFIEFILEGIVTQSSKALESLQNQKNKFTPTDHLLPRRQEILAIIRDHQIVSFDFLHRRFTAIPKSTLHHDLKKLREKGFVKKLGTTRSAVYTLV